MKILDIGCGANKYPDAVGIDRVQLPEVDVKWDIEQFPYPFKNGAFDMVVMQHVLEHVSREDMKNVKIIEECYRLLKPAGTLVVEVPLGQWLLFDPTHKNYVGHWYWNYFSHDFPLNYYTDARFKLVKADVIGLHGVRGIERFTRLLNQMYQKSPGAVERLVNFLNLDIAVKYELKKV
jgi:predicted SAM-dependent methyltransferase